MHVTAFSFPDWIRMIMKSSLLLCSLSMLALIACRPSDPPAQPDPASATPTEVAPAATVAPPPDTTMAVAGVQPPSAFDTKALTGRFSGALTCETCPGRHVSLELRADGTYSQQEAAADGTLAAPIVNSGTWAVEDGDAEKLLRLDPEIKQAPDRVFAIEASNLLRLRNADGTVLAGDDAVLTRQ